MILFPQMRNCFLSLCLLLALPISSFAQFDLSSLYYDSSKSYLKGEEVLLESDPSEIYTSKVDVPAGFPPPNSTYWSTSTEHVGDLTSTYSNDLANPPSSDNIEDVNVSDIGSPPPDEPPTFTETVLSVGFSENSIAEVAIIAAVNADSYLLSEQFDYQLFDFNQTSQKLTFLSPPDYESLIDDNNSDGVYTVVILATNDSGTTNQTLNISINNVIEAPVFIDGSSATVDFTSGGTGSVYTASATDGATFSISGGANLSLFSINSATGALSFISSPTYAEGSSNSYSVTITATNSEGSNDFSVTVDLIPEATTSSRFFGISTRGLVSSTKSMYGGIAITGTENKRVAFMGKGKTMEAQGVPDYAEDPALLIYKLLNGVWAEYKTVDDWGDVDSSESILTVEGKPGITMPVDSKEAAIVLDLEPGNYSVIVTSPETETKEAIVEAYEIPAGENSRFLGISTRGPVSSAKSMYGGIAITGTENKKVAFMGKGKTMEAQGVPDYAEDPALLIYKLSNGVWAEYKTVDDWGDVDSSESILTVEGKPGITMPVDSKEAAIVLDLEPGNYSVILTSAETETKEAIVEAYEIED
jgi:hypothetical protein